MICGEKSKINKGFAAPACPPDASQSVL